MRRLRQALAIAIATVAVGGLLGGCADAAAGSPGEQQSVVEGVEFYPACGNETLTLNGVTWYSFVPDGDGEFPTPLAFGSTGDWAGPGMSRQVATVAAPGPGDDTGTLIIYEGGYAYFRSDNGELTRWLTTDKVEYNFVC